MNLKGKKKAESREKILKAASQLFREKGFHATGVDELMDKAGLTAGAFYAHFKSKQDLLNEALQDCLLKNRKYLLEGLEGKTGSDYIEGILGKYVSALHRDNPKMGCPLPAVGPELYRASEETGQVVAQYIEKWIELMKDHTDGNETEKRAQTIRLFSQAVGGILLSRLVQSEKLSDEILNATKKVSK